MEPSSLSSLLAALYRRRLTVLLILAGSVGGSLFFARALPPVYLAKAAVFVPADMPRISLNSEGPNIPRGPVLPDTTEAMRIGIVGVLNSGAVHERVMERVPGLDAKSLKKNIIGDIDRTGSLLVYAYDTDADVAMRLANEFVAAFQEVMSDMVAGGPRRSLQALRDAEPAAMEALRRAEDERAKFLQGLGTADLAAELQERLQERERTRRALEDLAVQEREVAAQRPVAESQLRARPEFALSRREETPNNAYYRTVDEASDVETELAVKMLTYTGEHPLIRGLSERLRVLQARAQEEARLAFIPGTRTETLDEEGQRLIAQLVELDIRAASFAPSRAVLEERLAQVEERLAELPAQRAALERLDMEVSRARAYLESLVRRATEIELQLARGFDATYTDSSRLAAPEDVHRIPTTTGVLVFSVFAGLAVGLAVALGMELLRRARQAYPF